MHCGYYFNLTDPTNMAERRRKSWNTFKNEMKGKRHETGDNGGKKLKRAIFFRDKN